MHRQAVVPSDNGRMDVTAKLQIKPGVRVATLAASGDVPAVAAADANPPAEPADADAVIAFARTKAELTAEGVQPVRQVAIDEIWSALRFRPA
jgi:hypothetical protein